MKHISSRNLIQIVICLTSQIVVAQSLDSSGYADNFPGNSIESYKSYNDREGSHGVFFNIRDSLSRVIKQDSEYVYIKHMNTTYRKPLKAKLVMSYADPRPIPPNQHPGLTWAGFWEFAGDESAPARPNCTERPFTARDYFNILQDPNVKTKADFLRKIPSDALQKFTFIHKSKSLQKAGVTEETPRVMRFSADGRFVLTYTTNPQMQNHSTIEVIYFDDATRRYNFIHTQFVTENDIQSQLSPKSVQNPASCFACHGGRDPRPNWQEYDKWPYAYGGYDDVLESDTNTGSLKKYQAMLASLQNTPEITTLPWPQKESNLYPYYPYTKTAKEPNYNLRPNAHFTIVSSRLNAQRLARKFQQSPVYPKVKWSLLADALACTPKQKHPFNDQLNRQLFEQRGGVGKLDSTEYNYSSKAIYQWAKLMGFVSTDWNLNFSLKPGKFTPYNTAQWEMSDFVLSVLFRDLALEEPSLKKYDVRVNRMSNLFGRNFMCVDEIADKLWIGSNSYEPICEIVRNKARTEIESITPLDYELISQVKPNVWPSRNWETPGTSSSAQVGESIVKNTCAVCHQGDVLPFDFKNMTEFKENSLGNRAYVEHIEKMLGSPERCTMPMPITGPCLTDKERESVIKYLETFAK